MTHNMDRVLMISLSATDSSVIPLPGSDYEQAKNWPECGVQKGWVGRFPSNEWSTYRGH